MQGWYGEALAQACTPAACDAMAHRKPQPEVRLKHWLQRLKERR